MKRLLALLTLAVAAVAVTATALAAGSRADSGVVYAHTTHTEGKDLYVSGDLKDKLLGRGAIVYITRVTNQQGTLHVTARKITAYFPGGTLVGSGSADQTITATKTTVKNGVANLTT